MTCLVNRATKPRLRIVENAMETAVVYWGYIRIMEKMETIIVNIVPKS